MPLITGGVLAGGITVLLSWLPSLFSLPPPLPSPTSYDPSKPRLSFGVDYIIHLPRWPLTGS